ncbi:MAG: LytTR family transcriptional regulator [Gemmatirosa sp.]|nr:LytTR family transcriptional regulator [Gemmatirosa sp.]
MSSASALELAPPSTGGWSEYLAIRVRNTLRIVPVTDVDWFEAAGNYVRIHVGDECHVTRLTLGRLEARVDPRYVARIHRCMLVNVTRVDQIQPLRNGDAIVLLRSGEQLRMSRSFRREFMTRFVSGAASTPRSA